ncbi:hypothetical protein PMIN03_000197 [Paraphaeosphaeria minitans]
MHELAMSTSPESDVSLLEVEAMPQQAGVPIGLDWTGVSDPTRRRRLQNRLNQAASRARRRTKKACGATQFPSLPISLQPNSLAVQEERSESGSAEREERAVNQRSVCKCLCPNADPRVRIAMERFTQHAYRQYQQGVPNPSHLHMVLQINVNRAFDYNATTIGLALEHHEYDAISPFNKQGPLLGHNYSSQARDWPESLRPTMLQFTVEHHPWIDLFPFPRLRDNILVATEQAMVCDEDELCHDMCHYSGSTTPKAGLIVWGDASNPCNWEVSPEFIKRWGYLLSGCMELMEATNHWRAMRSEKTIPKRVFAEAIDRSYTAALRSRTVQTHESTPHMCSYAE